MLSCQCVAQASGIIIQCLHSACRCTSSNPAKCASQRLQLMCVLCVCECILIPGTFYFTALGGLPAGALDHLGIIGEQTPPHTDPEEPTAVLSIGVGLPPVPCKLVKRIQAGEFIDMAELLLDHLGIRAGTTDKDEKASKLKRCQVTNILEWVQCYSIYTAVISAKSPERTQDMLGYQALIVEACMEYEGDSWLGYDR